MKSTVLIFLSLGLYIASLFLPGIVFQVSDSDKNSQAFCALATQNKYICERFSSDYCFLLDDSKAATITRPLSQEDIRQYCAHWEDSTGEIMRGYTVLLWGWAGFFKANFAWWGNLLFFMALFLFAQKNYKSSYFSSLTALSLGLSALSLKRVPQNEAGAYDLIVDYLGAGYYVWLGAIIIIGAAAYFIGKNTVDQKVKLPLLLLIFALGAAGIASIPSILIDNSKSNLVESNKKTEELHDRYLETNFLTAFLKEFNQDNYKVTVVENGVISYYKKGSLIKVETQDPGLHLIVKDSKIYVIDPKGKTFTEFDVKNEEGKNKLREMSARSIIDTAMMAKDEVWFAKWQFKDNTQFFNEKLLSLAITFNPETKLISEMTLRVGEGADKKETIANFKYEKISEQALEEVKRFPSNYKKIDSF